MMLLEKFQRSWIWMFRLSNHLQNPWTSKSVKFTTKVKQIEHLLASLANSRMFSKIILHIFRKKIRSIYCYGVRSRWTWKAHRFHPSETNTRFYFRRNYLNSVWFVRWKVFQTLKCFKCPTISKKHDEGRINYAYSGSTGF